eukprot:3043365-Prymnesium_polylepis.1
MRVMLPPPPIHDPSPSRTHDDAAQALPQRRRHRTMNMKSSTSGPALWSEPRLRRRTAGAARGRGRAPLVR